LNQATLFPVETESRPLTIQERFEIYDRNHPEVWRLFVEFALLAKARGRTRYSARAIMQRIRWEREVEQEAAEPFKISNLWSSRYARKLVNADPETWTGFFELRQTKE